MKKVAIAALLICNQTAHAQQISNPEPIVGAAGWYSYTEVIGGGANVSNCIISHRSRPSMVELKLAWNPFTNKYKNSFSSHNWRSIQNDGEYAVGFRFEPSQSVILQAMSGVNVLVPTIYSWQEDDVAIVAFAESESVAVDFMTDSGELKTIAEIDLSGSSAAIKAMRACGNEMLRSAKAAEDADPFR